MKLHPRFNETKTSQKGATLVLIAFMLLGFISFAALAIDMGYLYVGRNELQNSADAAALAGTRVLGKIYQGDETLTPPVPPMSYADQQNYKCSEQLTFPSGAYGINGATNDCEFIIEQVKRTAYQNSAAGSDVTIRTEDIFIGTWNGRSRHDNDNCYEFEDKTTNYHSDYYPSLNNECVNNAGKFAVKNLDELDPPDPPDAVSVMARRDSLTIPIATFLAGTFGIENRNVSALATAALSGVGNAGPGELELPVGIPDTVFSGATDTWCQTDIKFSPPTDPDTCGGYTDFETDSSVTPNGLIDLVDGTTPSPGMTAGVSSATFNNGVFNVQLYDALLEAYETKGYDVDVDGNPRVDADGNPVAPGVSLHAYGIGDAVPLTEQTPYYDLNDGETRADVVDDPDDPDFNPQINYTPCPGGSGNCTGAPRYKHVWETGVVVYSTEGMSDPCIPNSTYKIVGFAELRMKDVLTAPDKYIVGELLCEYVSDADNRGSGGAFGKKGPIPGLVQ